jgi:outer membrane protein W/outer membrane protein OmpA-like peptidoglycan-associated protein
MNRPLRSAIGKALVAASLVAAPLASFAETSPWIFRVGGSYVNPKSENLESLTGTRDSEDATVVVDSALSFTGDVTYMFSKHFGVELLLATPFSHGVDAKPYDGSPNVRIADVEHIPPTLSLVWSFLPEHEYARPYVGAGVNYTLFTDEKLRGAGLSALGLPANTKLSIDDSVGPAAVVGIDLFPSGSRSWFINANARWMDIDADTEIRLPINPGGRISDTIEIDPITLGLHVGYRFSAPDPLPEPAPAVAPPPPPPPPPPAKCADTDMDGVCDEADKCPNTPAGTQVDSVGCPMIQTLQLLFDFDSAELRPESLTELERVVKFMGDVPFAMALVEGHTDSVGTEAYNQGLSDRRAKAVFDYLSSRGVDPARLKSIGYGELKPIADNATAEGRQQNRRVMLIRTDSGS